MANGLAYVGTGHLGALQAFAAAGCGLASCQPLYTYILPNGNDHAPDTYTRIRMATTGRWSIDLRSQAR